MKIALKQGEPKLALEAKEIKEKFKGKAFKDMTRTEKDELLYTLLKQQNLLD
jgi:hypothetical protein